MSNTVVGIFEYTSEAQEAKSYLLANGFSEENVDIKIASYVDDDGTRKTEEDAGDRIGNFFKGLFGDDENEVKRYSDEGRRGTIVTVHAETSAEAEAAARVLDNYGAVDFGETSGSYSPTEQASSIAESDVPVSDSIPVIEEELLVGKREVTTGGVRLKSKIVERPIEESIRLRQEHVTVQRTPVDRLATESDFETFKEGTIEVIEHAEVPVISKEARVVEEVSLGKQVDEKEEIISETVRHTEVDTESISERNDPKPNLHHLDR